MARKSIELSIVVPERSVFTGPVDEVILPGGAGVMGVLPGHQALLTTVAEGRLWFRAGEREVEMKLLGGFAEVTPSSVQILADGVEEPHT